MQVLAAAWQTGGMVQRGEFVGICGFASVDWAVSDMACLYTYALPVVAIHALCRSCSRKVCLSGMCLLPCLHLTWSMLLLSVCCAGCMLRTVPALGSG